jgi:hypothetical protein
MRLAAASTVGQQLLLLAVGTQTRLGHVDHLRAGVGVL